MVVDDPGMADWPLLVWYGGCKVVNVHLRRGASVGVDTLGLWVTVNNTNPPILQHSTWCAAKISVDRWKLFVYMLIHSDHTWICTRMHINEQSIRWKMISAALMTARRYTEYFPLTQQWYVLTVEVAMKSSHKNTGSEPKLKNFDEIHLEISNLTDSGLPTDLTVQVWTRLGEREREQILHLINFFK